MALFEKPWVGLNEAAEILGYTVDELIYFGGKDQLTIYMETPSHWVINCNYVFEGWGNDVVARRIELIKVPPSILYDHATQIDQVLYFMVDIPTSDIVFAPDYVQSERYALEEGCEEPPFWYSIGEHEYAPSEKDINLDGIAIDCCDFYISTETLSRLELEANTNQPTIKYEPPLLTNLNPALPTDLNPALPWLALALTKGKEINEAKPHLTKKQVAKKVHKHFISNNITGRGGKTLNESTIETEGLKKWSEWRKSPT